MKQRHRFDFKTLEPEAHTQATQKLIKWVLTSGLVHNAMRLPSSQADAVATWYAETFLTDGISFGAFERATGHLAAVSIMQKLEYGSTATDLLCMPSCYRQQTRLQRAVLGSLVSAKSVEAGHYLKGELMATRPIYAGAGIVSEMNKTTVDLARYLGCAEVGGSLSNGHLLPVFQRQGFEVTSQLRLTDYVDSETGEKPFALAQEPHEWFYWLNRFVDS